MKKTYTQSAEEVLSGLGVGADGLTTAQAKERLEQYGPNKLKEAEKPTLLQRFIEQLKDPMLIILMIAAGVSALTGMLAGESEWAEVIIILAVVLLNAVLGVIQESKAEAAIEALQTMTAATCKVLRDGKQTILHSDELVPGDVVLLEAGDAVPADGRIIENASLKIEEAAVIAGQVKAPGTYAPLKRGVANERARERRNTVLDRMAVASAISHEMADSLKTLPIDLTRYRRAADAHNEGTATYFREFVRRTMMAKEPEQRNYYTKWDYEQALKEYNENPIYGWCHKNLKANGEPYDIYRDGLKIYTTVDARMQRYAEEALQEHMAELVQPRMESQIRSRGGSLFPDLTKAESDAKIDAAMPQTDRWRNMAKAGATDKEIKAAFKTPVSMRVFTFNGVRDTVLTPRDSLIHYKKIMRASFVAIDPATGYVRAYIGGPDYRYFKYDAATQGKRQVGSTAKPFIYTFAIDHLGLSPCTPVPNVPVSIETPAGIWSPKEASEVEYTGINPLYWGLANSRNNYSAWIMKQAKRPEAVAEFIHDIGIKSFIDPVAALCIGSYDSNAFEMASAYSTFANQGVHIDPIFVTRIEDSQGNVLATFTPKTEDVLSKRVAYTMITMMQRVVTMGTARRMLYEFKFNDVEMAAKTGTTNDNVDAWFMCVVPNLVMGVWVGGEENSIHFTKNADGSRIALPIAGKFLTKVYDDGSLGLDRTDRFERSDEIPDYSCDKTEESSDEGEDAIINEEDIFFSDEEEFF